MDSPDRSGINGACQERQQHLKITLKSFLSLNLRESSHVNSCM